MTNYRLGYARVSTLEQDPGSQLAALDEAGCQEVFTDHASGLLTERPELTRLLEQLRKGDELVVWRLDRLGRSTSHLFHLIAELGERGVGFRSLTEAIDTTTLTGRLLFGIMASLAAFERDLIRERTMAGLAAARAGGRVGGRPPIMTPDKLDVARQMLAPASRRPSSPARSASPAPPCTRTWRVSEVEHRPTVATRPALLGEWDTEANDGLDPAVVTLGSGRRVWWRCAIVHRWQAKVDARARSGSRCPLCARRRASPENNLAATHPEVAALWHPDLNEGLGAAGVLAGSKRRVWWRCEAGHEWQARIDRSVDVRARHDSHCVLCMGWRASPENNLAVTHPEVAAQWHPDRNGELSPGAVLAGSRRRVWWRCEAGHEWQTKVCSRVARGSSCPMCRGQRVSATHNLAAVEPTVSATWHPTRNGELTAVQVAPRSGVRVWWQCEAGHEWQIAVYHRVDRGCPFCSRRRVTEETSVAALHPEWLPQWHPTRNGELTPDQVLVGSPRPLWWRCEVCRHDWVASAAARAHTGSGCQVCARANYRRAEAPLNVTHPAVAATWHPTANGAAVPEEVTYGSDRRMWWRCEAGHEWQTTVNRRTTGTRCPYCAGKLASPERNLAVVRPDFARQWHPTRNGSLTPAEVTPTSSVVEVWWQCEAGHEWAATPASRVQARRCPGCVAAPANNLAVALPAVAAQWHPERNGTLTPRDVSLAISQRLLGTEEIILIHHNDCGMRTFGSGCRPCAPTTSQGHLGLGE